MPFDYFNRVFIPHLRKYAEINAVLKKRGYYPKGGGNVEISIKPKYSLGSRNEAPKIELAEQGTLMHAEGISHASSMLQNANVAERQADAAKATLSGISRNIDIRTEYCNTLSPGSGITLWAMFSREAEPDELNPIVIGADTIGEKGVPAEKVGEDAAKMLLREIESKAPVDEHLADNLIPFLALFKGRIKVSRISAHIKANIYVAEQFLGKIFEIDEKENMISAKSGE
jgi:RNA 3'-phosphate cyclase